MITFVKDPSAKLDYTVNWEDWLQGDTISTSAWVVPTGITGEEESNTGTICTVWLSGGEDKRNYTVSNVIETVGGRKDKRTMMIKVERR